MSRKTWMFLLVQVFFIPAIAQQPDELLARWSARNPIEKIYLQLDRENYIAGETIWLKAYLYSDYLPDTISTSLYAELVNDSGRVINRTVMPVLLGTASSHLELPVSLTGGNYLIRAYTPSMLSQDTGFLFRRNISIYGKAIGRSPIDKMTRLEFFPEGGNIVSGLSNTLAFKATNEYGLPLTVKGTVFNEKNEKISSFVTYHDGMGLLDFIPVSKEKYYALLEGEPEPQKYYLPEPIEKGITLTVIPHPQGHFFELSQKKGYGKRGERLATEIIMTVVTRLEISRLKHEVQKIDPGAFIVMQSVNDTQGGMVKKKPLKH